MILPALRDGAMALAALPVLMTAINLRLLRAPPRGVPPGLAVSVVVPARDEAAAIGACLAALLASTGVEAEIIVVDDHSEDRTAALVREAAAGDPRVRLIEAPPLPAGWSGKQHACHVGAAAARHPILLFLDCDVRVTRDGVARIAAALGASRAALVSGFPREEAHGFGEMLLIPLIHVLLLGYLPIALMRASCNPSLGAGCGQIMAADAACYAAAGGHRAIRASWHDGLILPRAFRRAGLRTDLFDLTELASCRMYRGMPAVWRGLSKNAGEGMARPAALPVWTLLLAGGQIAPFVLLALAPSWPLAAAALALLAARAAVARRFRQPAFSVVLLPFGMAVLLALQWTALLRARAGRPPRWRGRTQFSP